jgi:hypothetical protein
MKGDLLNPMLSGLHGLESPLNQKDESGFWCICIAGKKEFGRLSKLALQIRSS